MAKNNRTCSVCGKHYSYCNNCSSDNSKPSWMTMFCSENCKDLFMTATDYFAGEITPSKAKAVLNKLDISNTNIKPSVLRMIDELKDVASEEITEADIQTEPVVFEQAVTNEAQLNSEVSEIVEDVSDENIDMLGGYEAIPTNSDRKFNKKNKKNKFDTNED